MKHWKEGVILKISLYNALYEAEKIRIESAERIDYRGATSHNIFIAGSALTTV